MLSKEQIKTIADTLKVDAEKLANALNSQDTVELKLPKLKTFTDEEYSTLETNLSKKGYDEGKVVGSEKTAKKFKEVSGIEIEGKGVEKIFTAIKEKIENDAKIEPNEKVSNLESKVQKLQTTIQTLETEKTSLETKHSDYKQKIELFSHIPENTIGLSKEVVFNEMIANGFETKIIDGKRVTSKNGVELVDNVQNPIPFSDVATSFLTDKNWLKVDESRKGRGFGDEGSQTGTPKNYTQFVEQCKKDGINPAGAEAQQRAKVLATENPEFYDN